MAKKFIGGYISNSFNGFSGPITTVEYLVVAGGGGVVDGLVVEAAVLEVY